VSDSKIYDNDLSFNSGWGLALWRCNRNVISRNACDFCVRGYSHGVYNRGQDSAGILMFEQNCENVIAENSATHGGDCFFGFAGREALGEDWLEKQRAQLRQQTGEQHVDNLIKLRPEVIEQHRRRGNNDNLLIKNDFSYAPAHGIEMTFSFGNRFIANRMVANAICGVWGGYSQDTLIAGNEFVGNGEMGYGLERGGVNIEHGKNNRIVHNTFRENKCGVHLWWDEDKPFLKTPWAHANGVESRDNLIAANEFSGEQVVFHFRGPSQVTLGPNEIRGAGKDVEADPDSEVIRKPDLTVEPFKLPDYPVYGKTRPIGARRHLRGRQNIVMTERGPWAHASPLIRVVKSTGRSIVYDLHQMPDPPEVTVTGEQVRGLLARSEQQGVAPQYTIESIAPGVHPYVMRVRSGDFAQEIKGTLVNATWNATFFSALATTPLGYTFSASSGVGTNVQCRL
jgi:hypothetical protein